MGQFSVEICPEVGQFSMKLNSMDLGAASVCPTGPRPQYMADSWFIWQFGSRNPGSSGAAYCHAQNGRPVKRDRGRL
jgi:hypothetical protein